VRGALNGVAPIPVTNADFTQTLANTLHRPALFPVPAFALKLLFGEMSEILLASQRVLPAAPEAAGFKFRFPELGGALKDLLGS
jgi:NAD dependent epimerase/dehydratase family enzyme